MIFTQLQKKQKLVAAFMAWIMGTSLVLPAWAGGISSLNTPPAGFTYQKTTSRRTAVLPLAPAGPSFPGLKAPKKNGHRLPVTSELVLQSSGPTQPEMSSFQSVGTANMVDPFSGDFSYNIPLLDVGGYPINIHYGSNIGMDQESSWVGLGWNINPGTISRNMRGLPDDFNGVDSITRSISTKPNVNLGLSVAGAGLEIFGKTIPIPTNLGITYDNYRGYGLETGVTLRSPIGTASKANAGVLTGSLSFSNSSTAGLGISPTLSYSAKAGITAKHIEYGDVNNSLSATTNYNSRVGLTALSVQASSFQSVIKATGESVESNNFSIPASISFTRPTFVPRTEIPYTAINSSFNVKTGASFLGFFANASVSGQMGTQFIAAKNITQYYPAFGYLHFSRAAGNNKALLDYNRENDGPFVDKITPAIAIPQYTYDVYTISAEGTGGAFRPYRSDAGFVYSSYNRTNSASLNIGFDAGLNKIGTNIKPVYSYTQTNAWLSDNHLKSKIEFLQKDSIFEDVVFRNPMEMPVQSKQYLNAIGHDTLIRPIIEGSGANTTLRAAFMPMPNTINSGLPIRLPDPIKKEKREKRNQVISYLSAEDASLYGLNRNLLSYKQGFVPYTYCVGGIDTIARVDNYLRKKHHLSEITVLNEDGRRYIYGIPAYSISQQNMTFAVNPNNTDLAKGQTDYTSQEASITNKSGVDGYFSSETVPGYAHSFLLSGILSSDYVDVTGDGITDDDLGDAVKFGYTRVYDYSNRFGWRVPVDAGKAALAEGLKTYSRDDKASIVRGEKEIWYLHSVVSKNMVAVFYTAKDRSDTKSQAGVNGQVEADKQLMRLTRIDLFSKAALVAGPNAKPVKSVFFEYDYSLCRANTAPNSGKLTLRKIYFTYNGNHGKKSNPYTFQYNGQNPMYHPKHTDAWGNYKDPATNPGQLSNIDYPYPVQGSQAVANQQASAWCLTDIGLPSKGSIKVTYESDDYAYVQHKRAMQLFTIAGLGASPYANPEPQLWSNPDASGNTQVYDYVFINLPDPVNNSQEFFTKYLEGIEQLYFKIFVKMPPDRWGSGNEFVPMVCELQKGSYGIISNRGINSTRGWIQVKRVGNESPMAHYALQFLKEQLPSKAYPGSETGSDPDIKTIINVIGSQGTNIVQTVQGFDKVAKSAGFCQQVDVSKSFVKLNNPTRRKLGGGLRVKKVEVFDNFAGMTANQMRTAVYGQEYDYTTITTVLEAGIQKNITISSGVAAYEPFIGGEENALKGYYAYQQQMTKLGPISYKFVDTPFCESLFPAASVGYSKVTVRSIHNRYVSSTGREVYCFYTYKDFPTRWSFTPLDNNSRKRHQPPIGNFLKINAKHYLTLSQGFKVELNDMHGKTRSHAFYSQADTVNPLTYTENVYRTKTLPGEPTSLDNKVWATDGPEAPINTNASMGQAVEIMTDLREQTGFTGSANIELNVDILNLFLVTIPWFGATIWPQWEKTRYRSASVLKVVNNYGILDSIYQVDKGSVVGTRNLVYDSETGNVLLTRTNNAFKDPVYNFSYPARWAYSGMGMAYRNIHAEFGRFTTLNLRNGRLFDNLNNPFATERYFESGDECLVQGLFLNGDNLADPDCNGYNSTTGYAPATTKAWALDARKGTSGSPQLFFIDANGRPISASAVVLKIMRSGFRNLTGSSVGGVTTLANPIGPVPGGQGIVINDSRRIVNASATTYRDCWRVDNTLYAKDTIVTKTKQTQLTVKADVTLARKRVKLGGNGNQTSYNISPVYTVASRDWIPNCPGDNTTQFNTKGIMRFDLPPVPSGDSISNATVKLWPRHPQNLWERQSYGCQLQPSNSNNDWAKETTRWRTTTITPKLRRLVSNFNTNTLYDQLLTTPTNEVSLSSYTGNFAPIEANVTNLVKDLVKNPSGGYHLALEEPYSDGLAFMSFAAVDETIYDPTGPNKFPGAVYFKSQYYFYAPSLTLTYTAKQDSVYTLCRPAITDTTNPYRWGIYGNWRPHRNMVYYHDRSQSDPAVATNLRTDGTLANFVPYWLPTTQAAVRMRPTTDTVKWVWNAASTLVNSRGAEVEGVDALGRYTSAHFGYNDNLPVAVVQNAMYKQAAFDGFEDYQYRDQYCNTICPNPRFANFMNFSNGVGTLVDTVAHSGLYSLRFSPGQQAMVAFALSDTAGSFKNLGCDTCGVVTKIDSLPVFETLIVGKGMGMSREIKSFCSLGDRTRDGTSIGVINPDGATTICTNLPTIAPVQFAATQVAVACPELTLCDYKVSWSGAVQATETGLYTFRLAVNPESFGTSMSVNGSYSNYSVSLQKGAFAQITIVWPVSADMASSATAQLLWSRADMPEAPVPTSLQYRFGFTPADTAGSVLKTPKKWCLRMNRPRANPDSFLVLPLFSPVKNATAYVVSAWIREDMGCQTTLSGNTGIRVSFDQGTSSVWQLVPTGVPIEGWQRVEATIGAIPQAATRIRLNFFATGIPLYVDDIRIHPYNSSLKSFVYSPLNLRLMAELDENNYASFYEYDEDGTLVRVKKETERGIMTIKETRSALAK